MDFEIEFMKILLPLFLLWCIAVQGETVRGFSFPYNVDSIVPDNQLEITESICHFSVNGIYDTINLRFLDYSVDDFVGRISFVRNAYFPIQLKGGIHHFQFFYDGHHTEISIPAMEIRGGAHTYFTLNFTSTDQIIISAKPVIYLYPQVKSEVKVTVRPNGSQPFYYPYYDGQWEVLADPDGTLKTADGNAYRYLFWEAQQPMGEVQINSDEGFVIAGDETVAFLEASLNAIGFNSKERADFITFWAPKMQGNAWNYIHFVSGEACQQFAELKVDPAPDELFRFYLLWHPSDAQFQAKPQTLPHFDRSGFSVLEWGGQEYPKNSLYPVL